MRGQPGKLRYRLAELLSQLTGWLVEAHNIHQNNPMHLHYEDMCRWCVEAQIPGTRIKGHIYSWCTMADCVRYGVVKVDDPRNLPTEIEVCANEPK